MPVCVIENTNLIIMEFYAISFFLLWVCTNVREKSYYKLTIGNTVPYRLVIKYILVHLGDSSCFPLFFLSECLK